LGGGAIADGETRAKNASGNGPLVIIVFDCLKAVAPIFFGRKCVKGLIIEVAVHYRNFGHVCYLLEAKAATVRLKEAAASSGGALGSEAAS
jgi:hypothetical protein